MFGFSLKAGVQIPAGLMRSFPFPIWLIHVLGVRSSLLTFICAGFFFSRLDAVKILVFFFRTSDTERSRITVTLNGERYLLHKDVTDPSAAM